MTKFPLKTLVVMLAAMPIAVYAEEAAQNAVDATPMLDAVSVTSTRSVNPSKASLSAFQSDKSDLLSKRATTGDSARLLQDIPGVSLYGAGGISSLPVIHGLADDRIRIQVDGMDLMSACPNHMNSTLSYIDPANVASVTVFAGITPVSVGGDSIAGTIQMTSARPSFADAGQDNIVKGKVGTFFRSNSNALGVHASATVASENLNITYSASTSRSNNYQAGGNFKAAGPGQVGSAWLGGNVVGSSAYKASNNQEIGFAYRNEGHLFQLNVSEQKVGLEGFPNQRMDMTANQNTSINFHYTGLYSWGDLEARLYDQDTRHKMDMGPDRVTYGTGMPMFTKAKTRGALLQGNIIHSERDIFRLGAEYQAYTLYDWWPPVGGTMGPNAFWNIDFGQRNKLDIFGEWEARWSPAWLTQLGIRSDAVMSNAAVVQGYDNGLAALWGNEAAIFNARNRKRSDQNWDMTALTRYTPDASQTFEAGYARKSHAPNLYQRYPWSSQPMAALMNNFVGDGNGYIGNVDLKPEVAHTLSVSGDWHDVDDRAWQVKATGYYSYIQNYIDAQRCNFGQCGAANMTTMNSFVLLQYVNQTAELYGMDLSADTSLGSISAWGHFKGRGVLNYVSGKNRTTGDNLYNIMPLNAKLAVTQTLGSWHNTAEMLLVSAKTNVSQVRNEIKTGGYGLLNLRTYYDWQQVRLDIGIENVFNRFYAMPLGGAYVGQGASMATNGIAWGVAVPGMGRSLNAALNVTF